MRRRPQLAAGQEWVWDYPRPPRLEPCNRLVRVVHAGIEVARSERALRILETSHPPAYYFPPEDVNAALLQRTSGGSYCEWKGSATYYDLVVASGRAARCAWSYASPSRAYAGLTNHIAFYSSRVDECYVGDELVQPQAGDFYGGWITSTIVGPFKGGPGTLGW